LSALDSNVKSLPLRLIVEGLSMPAALKEKLTDPRAEGLAGTAITTRLRLESFLSF
jgi:hypothetical protein